MLNTFYEIVNLLKNLDRKNTMTNVENSNIYTAFSLLS